MAEVKAEECVNNDNWLLNIFASSVVVIALFVLGILVDFVQKNPEVLFSQSKILD